MKAAATPDAHLIQSIRGRVRLRVPDRRRNRRYFTRVQSRLKKLPGVKSVVVNVLSGSILIHHELALEELGRYAEDNGLFRIVLDLARSRALSERLSDRFESIGNALQEATGGALDVKGLLILALAGAGAFQLLRRKTLPEGTSLLWYAIVLLREDSVHRERIRASAEATAHR